MPRPKHLNPARPVNVHLDPELMKQVDVLLYSELEEKVPFGAYAKFFNLILGRALVQQSLDLAPFLNTQPGEMVVRGDPNAIAKLRKHLEGRS